LSYFTEFDSFAVTVAEDRLYNIRKISSPSYIWQKRTHTSVAWSLCDS